MNESKWDVETDVLVVGSGNGAFTAALTAKLGEKLDALMIEKMPYCGGSSAISGGGVWIPNNPVNVSAGVADSMAEGRRYMEALVGDDVPHARVDAFLNEGPKAIEFLINNTSSVRYMRTEGYPDYHPEIPGGKPRGRSIEPVPVDAKTMGDEVASLTPGALRPPGGIYIIAADLHYLAVAASTWQGRLSALKVGTRSYWARLRGRRMMSCGAAGVARLWKSARDAGIEVWRETPLESLVFEDGRVVGAVAKRDGKEVRIRARRGVVLAAGGFERNDSMRKEYQQQPITGHWTMGCRGNEGDAIRSGMALGAGVSLMDDAWWGPAMDLGDSALFLLIERALPGSIIVNSQGKRYFNEAAPYVNFVHAMYAGEATGVEHIPSYLIFDQRFRNRYPFSSIPPRLKLPEAWYESGAVVQAPDLLTLATKIGLPAAALRETIDRFNGFADSGIDDDFGRGRSAYDNWYSDPSSKPNPNLGRIETSPFFAVKLVAGDLGTKGGLVTDEHARVLREDGSPITGLYATGNCSSSVMGHEYPGPGATLGPAMTFGYIAARHLAREVTDVATAPRPSGR